MLVVVDGDGKGHKGGSDSDSGTSPEGHKSTSQARDGFWYAGAYGRLWMLAKLYLLTGHPEERKALTLAVNEGADPGYQDQVPPAGHSPAPLIRALEEIAECEDGPAEMKAIARRSLLGQ